MRCLCCGRRWKHIPDEWKIDMNWKYFIAERIYRSKEGGKEVSKPAVRIAMLGIAIGLAVMIVTVAIVVGFKHEVRDQVVGLGADISITHFDSQQSFQTVPIVAGDSLIQVLNSMEGVAHVQRYATKPGMIMTDDSFQGMVLKGVAQEYDRAFLEKHLQEGEIPLFTDSVASNQVLVSRTIADKLRLKCGDKIYTYYIEDNVRARRLTIAGIYQTHFAAYDDLFLITDLYTVARLNSWQPDLVSGVEVTTDNSDLTMEVKEKIRLQVDQSEGEDEGIYYTRTVEEANPQIFSWLSLLDTNVWIILFLMTGVAGFTMISGLLIIILERTNMIGVLKALGADDTAIRKIFLTFSVFLIGRGMVWGNVIGLTLCFVQGQFHVFALDPNIYYIDRVPIEFNLWWYLLLNVSTLAVSVLMLVGPSYLVTRIHPARSIRFE